jgi:hypothetical protein
MGLSLNIGIDVPKMFSLIENYVFPYVFPSWKKIMSLAFLFKIMISDISATSFYKAQPVMAFAVEYLNPRDTSRMSDQDRLKVSMVIEFFYC